jgi:hypothetical protein
LSIVQLSEQKSLTLLSLDDSLSYIIGDEAEASGMEEVTNVFSFKGEIDNSPAEYSKGNRYFIAPMFDARERAIFLLSINC